MMGPWIHHEHHERMVFLQVSGVFVALRLHLALPISCTRYLTAPLLVLASIVYILCLLSYSLVHDLITVLGLIPLPPSGLTTLYIGLPTSTLLMFRRHKLRALFTTRYIYGCENICLVLMRLIQPTVQAQVTAPVTLQTVPTPMPTAVQVLVSVLATPRRLI